MILFVLSHPIMSQSKPSQIVVVVIGTSGSGKTNWIRRVCSLPTLHRWYFTSENTKYVTHRDHVQFTIWDTRSDFDGFHPIPLPIGDEPDFILYFKPALTDTHQGEKNLIRTWQMWYPSANFSYWMSMCDRIKSFPYTSRHKSDAKYHKFSIMKSHFADAEEPLRYILGKIRYFRYHST